MPALAQSGGASRTLQINLQQADGQAISDAVVGVRTPAGVTKATAAGNGQFYVSGVGGKATIEIESDAYGSSVAEVILPAARFVNLEVTVSNGVAQARVVDTARGSIDLLSAVAPDGIAAGSGDCCVPNGTPGCDDPDCEAIVCGVDPFCCDTEWDSICADEAADLCGDLCGGGGGGGCDPPLECPAGALEEGEACGSDTNGGCNSSPPVFTDAACGDTFCGTAWADGGMRDTDWYLVTVDEPTIISATLTSAFQGVAFIVDGIDTCSPVVVGDIGCSSNCTNEQVASADLPAGTYAVFVATGDCLGGGIFEGFPCGGGNNDYVVEITCEPGMGGGGPCPGDGDCCVEGGNGTPGCNDEACCDLICGMDPFCCDVSWDGLCADAAQDLCDICGGGGGPCPGDGDCCVEGGNGTPGCNDEECCNLICGIDPFCCDVSWDGLCADQAQDLCEVCAGGGGPCPGEGDCCVDNGTPGCNDEDCCNIVCGVDPFCCDVSWDGLCADQAADLCGDLCGGGEPPANDNCEDAIPLEIPSSVDGTTLGATPDEPPAFFCGTSVGAPGVWYSVTGTGTTITASTCDQADYDTKISVFCGECFGDLQCVAGQDDASGCGGFTTELSWCSQAGAEYLILVHGFGGDQGNFTLTVSEDGASCDADVLCLPVEACCLPGGACEDLTPEECMALGGDPQGPGTTCSGDFQFVVEACDNPFEDISGSGTLAPNASSQDDGGDAGIPLGFTFNFFGDDHTTVGIASNGYLTFGTDLSDFTNDPIPDDSDPNDLIAPLWDDWSPNQAGDVHYQTQGAAGSQQFIAQWTNVPHFDVGGSSTFQVVLYEGSNCIEYRYDPFVFDSPTIGVENQDGTEGESVATVSPGDCVRFCPEEIGGVVCEIPAEVDIKPGSCPNSFNRNSNGVLPVALAGTMDIDANMVDISSLTLSRADGMGGSVSPIEGPPGPHTVINDVATPFEGEACDCHELEGDGIDDVSMKFDSNDVVDALMLNDFPAGAMVELRLSGSLLDGTSFAGTDCVRLVPPGTPPGVLLIGSNVPDVWVNVAPIDEQLDGGGFTSFNRSFPQTTEVTVTVPVVPVNYPQHVLAGWFIDGVQVPADIDPAAADATLDIVIDGDVQSVALLYQRQGGHRLPGGGGIQSGGGAGIQSD